MDGEMYQVGTCSHYLDRYSYPALRQITTCQWWKPTVKGQLYGRQLGHRLA